MKVIDLLNKIANGEEIPNQIKYYGLEYTLDKKQDDYMIVCSGLLDDINTFSQLNDEVEVIEEDKKIEKLYLNKSSDIWAGKTDTEIITDKINEIIEVINDKHIGN